MCRLGVVDDIQESNLFPLGFVDELGLASPNCWKALVAQYINMIGPCFVLLPNIFGEAKPSSSTSPYGKNIGFLKCIKNCYVMKTNQKSHVSFGRRLGGARVWTHAPFKRRAKTYGCGCDESACGGIVCHLDVLLIALGIHQKQNVLVAAAKVWLTRWRLGRRRKRSAANNAHFVARTLAAATTPI